MNVYSTYVPRAPLADFVERLWLYESTTTPPHARERRLPNGSVELVINLCEDMVSIYDRQGTNKLQSFCSGVISGPYSTFFVIETRGLSSLIGAAFKPGGAAPFLPFPVAELQNKHVSLETLWGSPAFELRDRLTSVDTPQARFSILEQWLLTRARQPLYWRPPLTFALSSLQTTQTISEVVEQTGLSSRRFIQIFHETVGLTPKQFARVKRFQEVLRLVEKGEPIVWADIALRCGYYDQAHFIHDFQGFCGLTPRTYLAQRGEFRNHIPLLD